MSSLGVCFYHTVSQSEPNLKSFRFLDVSARYSVTSTKEVMFSVLFLSRIMEKLLSHFSWNLVEGWAKEEPITFWSRSEIMAQIHKLFFTFVNIARQGMWSCRRSALCEWPSNYVHEHISSHCLHFNRNWQPQLFSPLFFFLLSYLLTYTNRIATTALQPKPVPQTLSPAIPYIKHTMSLVLNCL